MSTLNALRRSFEGSNLFRDSSHHSIWTLLAVGSRDHCIDMVLSDSMGFSFPSSWCSVGRSHDGGTGTSEGRSLEAVCVCVCGMTAVFFMDDDRRRAVINWVQSATSNCTDNH